MAIIKKVTGFANRWGGREPKVWDRMDKIKNHFPKKPKFKIKLSEDLQFYWTLVAPNGQVLMNSETYKQKQSCKKSIASSKKHVYGLYVTGGPPYQFHHVRQQAGNGNILGSSEVYFNRRGAQRALETMKRYIPIAEIVDTTKK